MAASSPVPQPARLEPGRIIRDGIALILREPSLLFGLALVATFAASALVLLVRALIGANPAGYLLTFMINAAGSTAAYVAVTRAALASADGRPITFGEAYHAVGSAAFRVFGTSLVLSLAIGAGMLLFILPGVWLATVWIVAIPAAIVEDMGPVTAARRSSQLTRGHRWPAFVLILLTVLVGVVITLVISLLIGLPVGLLSGPEAVETADGYTRLGQALEAVGVAIQAVLSSTFGVLAWRRLRVIQGETPGPA